MRLKRSPLICGLVVFAVLFMLTAPSFAEKATLAECLAATAKCLLATFLTFNPIVYVGGTLSCTEGLAFCIEYLM
ncbi:MAG: hypothetical protein WCC00_13980 [Candidatus Aminicenantales bacterium]